MAYINFNSGFKISTKSAIDKRAYLSKAEMKTAHEKFAMPDRYWCICSDDGKIYLYSSANTVSATLGKFRTLESTLNIKDTTLKVNLDNEIKAKVEEELNKTVADGGEIE